MKPALHVVCDSPHIEGSDAFLAFGWLIIGGAFMALGFILGLLAGWHWGH